MLHKGDFPNNKHREKGAVKRTFAGGTEERLGSILGWTLLRRASGDEKCVISQILKTRSC